MHVCKSLSLCLFLLCSRTIIDPLASCDIVNYFWQRGVKNKSGPKYKLWR